MYQIQNSANAIFLSYQTIYSKDNNNPYNNMVRQKYKDLIIILDL